MRIPRKQYDTLMDNAVRLKRIGTELQGYGMMNYGLSITQYTEEILKILKEATQ